MDINLVWIHIVIGSCFNQMNGQRQRKINMQTLWTIDFWFGCGNNNGNSLYA